MTSRQRPIGDAIANGFGQLQEPQRVGDVTATLADQFDQVGLGELVLLNKLLVALRFFERIQVRTLHVLNNGDLERNPISQIPDHDGDIVNAGALRCAPPAFAGYDLVSCSRRRSPNDERLYNAVLADGLREVI